MWTLISNLGWAIFAGSYWVDFAATGSTLCSLEFHVIVNEGLRDVGWSLLPPRKHTALLGVAILPSEGLRDVRWSLLPHRLEATIAL